MTLSKNNYNIEAKRVVIIAILDYNLDLTKEIKRMETKWKLREEIDKDLVLTGLNHEIF